jgi:hypothetical protein
MLSRVRAFSSLLARSPHGAGLELCFVLRQHALGLELRVPHGEVPKLSEPPHRVAVGER